MNKNSMMAIGKWVLMGLLTASNFMFYIVNDSMMNLVLAILILVYSIFEFFVVLSGKKLRLANKLYLFSFYLLATVSLFICVRSFLMGNFKSALVNILLIGGDTALILYSIHKLTPPVR